MSTGTAEISTLSLTSKLIVGGWSTPHPLSFYLRKRDPVHIAQEADIYIYICVCVNVCVCVPGS